MLLRVLHDNYHKKTSRTFEIIFVLLELRQKHTDEGLATFLISHYCIETTVTSYFGVKRNTDGRHNEAKSKRNEDPIISFRELLNAFQNLHECYYNDSAFDLVFYKRIGRKILGSHKCPESLIYSTCKTKS